MSHANRISMIIAAGLATAVTGISAPAEALGPGLRLAEAERAALAAVAPHPVDEVLCVRSSSPHSGIRRSRAACLVAHPAPIGQICRSVVAVKKQRSGAIQARADRLHVCQPFPDLQP